MANDFRLLNEAYQLLTEAFDTKVERLDLDFENNQLPHMLTIVGRLEVNQGVGFYDRPSGNSGGIFVEKRQVGHDEFGWRFGGWGNKEEFAGEEKDLELIKKFLVNSYAEDPNYFKYYELYIVRDQEGRPLQTKFDRPYDEPEDIEPYGPDPGPRMQDLQ